MARRKGTGRKYTKAQKLDVLKRVQAGETQVAVATSSGVPLATVGYWARKAKGAGTAPNGDPPHGEARTPGRLRKPHRRKQPKVWRHRVGLDGDTLVIRIPLRVFARQIAEEALARI
jgi:hypothetical protein